MKQVTVVIVSYNTKPELQRCIEAVRKYYPTVKIILVDGSQRWNPCFEWVQRLNDRNINKQQVLTNIGHGQGMNLAMGLVGTKYAWLLDSDAYLKEPGLGELLLAEMGEMVYGAGQVLRVNKFGHNSENGVPYLHPHCAMVNVSLYKRFPKFIHHGAPLIETMLSLAKQRTFFLAGFPVMDYCEHGGRGTRKLVPPGFDSGLWDRKYLKTYG